MKSFIVIIISITLFWISAGCNTINCKNPQECYQKGLVALNSNKREQAYQFLAKAAKDDPSNIKYQWAAARAAPNPKFAVFHVKSAWDNGFRSREVFTTYLGLLQITEAKPSLQFALQIYEQLPDSLRTDAVRAGIFYNFRVYDSTIAIFQKLFSKTPSALTGNSLAKAHLAKGENVKAKEVLLRCRNSKLLDSEGYSLLNSACLREFDYAGCAAVFESAKKEGLYSDGLKLIHARGLIAQGKETEAEPLLQELAAGQGKGTHDNLAGNARMALAYSFLIRGDSTSIIALKKKVPDGETGRARHEKMFLDAIIKRLSDTASLVPVLNGILKEFPAYPEIQIVFAQELARSGKNNEALKVFRNLPDLYRGSPRIVVENARLLDRIGKSSDALAILSLLHSKKLASRRSLELFRDISFKKNLTDDAMYAQKILEQTYKNDVGVRWAQGVIFMKNGTIDSAIKVFSALSREYPKEARFFYALFSAYFSKGDFSKVIKECSGYSSSDLPFLRLQARAFVKSAMPAQADSVYGLAMEGHKKDAGIGMEYAEFLMHNGNPVKAAEIYTAIIDKKSGASVSDTGKAAAVVLNNLAWSLLQTEGAKKETVLAAIKKAYAIDKTNSSIIDTYIEALFRYGRYSECIDLLEANETVRKNGPLLVRLADAYEKTGKENSAVRTLQEAEKLFSSDGLKQEAIRKRIEAIIARK